MIASQQDYDVYSGHGLIRMFFIPGFSDLPYRFQEPGPSQYIYMQISVLITDNYICTLPKRDDFQGTLFTI